MSTHDDSNRSGDDPGDEKISALYRQLPDTQPSPETDALIRAAARRAINSGPRKTPFTANTQRLLATAATLALGVALLVQWQHDPEKLQDALAIAPSASLPAPVQESSPENTAAAPARESVDQANADAERLADIHPGKENTVKKMPAAPTEKFPQETAQEPVLAGASTGTLSAPEAASRTEDEARLDKAEAYLAARDDRARKAGAASSNSLRIKSEAAASAEKPAAPAAAIISAAPLALKKQASADSAAEEMKADTPAGKPKPYQQAMQTGNWELAQKTFPASAQSDPVSLQIDRDLVAQRQGSRQRPGCAALTADALGPERLLCDFLIFRAEGRALPADMMRQLEEAGLVGGAMEYRRTAVSALGKH